MVASCPYCAKEIGDPLLSTGAISGARICPHCGKTFELYVIERPYQSIAPELLQSPLEHPALAPKTVPPLVQPPPLIPPPIPSPVPEPPVPPLPVPSPQHLPQSEGETPLGPIPLSPCAYHPSNRATARCTQCARLICNLCATPIDGKDYCPQCFEVLHARGTLGTSQRAFGTPSLALGLSLASLFMGWVWCVGLILGPLGIYFATRALAEINLRPDLPGRKKAVAAIVISALGMFVSIGVWIAFFAAAALSGAGD
jgi:hypothetical protein